MGAQKPQRPAPGHAMLLPRTGADPAGNTVQRAFDAVSQTTQQVQKTAGALADTVAGQASGRMLAAPILLTGSGSDMLPAGTCVVAFDGIGGGGGGGGAAGGGGGNIAAAAGGSSGVRLRKTIGTPGVPLSTLAYSWSGGAPGAAGTAAPGAGGVGGDSILTVDGSSYTMKGGGGGAGAAGVAANGNYMPTPPAAGTSGVAGESGYDQGGIGTMIGGGAWSSGAGGGTDLGAGGASVSGTTAGNPGQGLGGGGSGAAASGAGTAAGGAGAAGGIWITPYS